MDVYTPAVIAMPLTPVLACRAPTSKPINEGKDQLQRAASLLPPVILAFCGPTSDFHRAGGQAEQAAPRRVRSLLQIGTVPVTTGAGVAGGLGAGAQSNSAAAPGGQAVLDALLCL